MTRAIRFRRLGALAAAGVTLVLASCAIDQQGQVVQGTSELCAEIEGRANEAFRRNFLTEYDRAERAWTDILALYDQRADEVAACPDIPPRSIVLANLGLVYSNQRNFTAAIGMLDASAATGGEAVASRTKIYRALHDLNRSAVGAGTLEQAELASVSAGESQGLAMLERDLSSSVLQLSREAQRQLIEESVNLAALSFAYMARGRNDNAMVAIEAALARVAPIDGAASSYVPRFLVTKAEVQLARGETDAALSTVREAIRAYGADMRRSALMARAEVVQGRILAAMGRDNDALDAFKRGFDILKGVPVRISYDLLWPYVELVQKVIAATPARRAELTGDLFRAAQVVRSQTTASSVSLAAASLAEGTSAIAEAVRELNRASEELALVVAQKLMVEGRGALSSPGLVGEVTRRFEIANDREHAALERVLALDPDYLERISGSASIAALQGALEGDEAYVQIVLGEPESLVFVIRKDVVRMYTVAQLSAADTTAIVAELRDILRTQFIYAPNQSYRIYQAFIEPAEAELAGASKLIFSLSDALTALPMEILATRQSQISDLERLEDFTDVAWLGAAYDVSYVPAPRNLIDLRAAPRHDAPRRIVAFGDFQPGADVQEILAQSFLPEECLGIAQAIAQLPALAGTRAEVATVGAIFGAEASELIEGADFTETRIAEESAAGTLRDFSVLHFATHGILPMGDCIRRPALSVSAKDVPGSDGLLTDVEIRRLSLDADLVVLSACDTAGSAGGEFNAAGGEALSGLARAFFDAGSRAILATHWPVSDATTARIVQDFYASLRAGASMSAALRGAQTALRQNPATSDPVFWGAFVMIGDARQTLTIR
ncbi:MAG: CHAT domain-containing protein [Thermohalobaculum sp.]|nr:CHAT domain-containing protein [Thermohalobaculum sp.]